MMEDVSGIDEASEKVLEADLFTFGEVAGGHFFGWRWCAGWGMVSEWECLEWC